MTVEQAPPGVCLISALKKADQIESGSVDGVQVEFPRVHKLLQLLIDPERFLKMFGDTETPAAGNIST